jgi:hypothetical protein
MKYVITMTLECTYEIDAECYTKEQAISLAEEWFAEAEPRMIVQKLAPCQLGEPCPYNHSIHSCSDCR